MTKQLTFQKSNQMRNLAHECRANHVPNVTLWWWFFLWGFEHKWEIVVSRHPFFSPTPGRPHHFLFFLFPFLSFSVQFESLGCFKDSRPRSLPLLVENLRKYIDWNNMTKTVRACAELVQRRGLAIFGIQFYGECWSGVDAWKTYDKYGPSKNCRSGVGREGSYFVYKLKE